MLEARTIARALGGEVSGNAVRCPGPGHSPRDRSLSITIDAKAPDGFIVHSHAGDDALKCKDYVREKLRLAPFKPNGTNGANGSNGLKIVSAYDYRDEDGKLLFQVCRLEPKSFRQRVPNGSGWTWKLRDTRRVLYRLPEILKAVADGQTIFVVEGEKGADALVKLGLAATCSSGGAGKWQAEYADDLKGADVVVVPDNDEPGEAHARDVAASLQGIASKVRLPGMAPKEDIFDWIRCGGTAEQLRQLANMTAEATEELLGPRLLTRNAAEIEPELVEWMWDSRLARGKLTAIAGEPGLGKSQWGIFAAAAISRGGDWPNDEGKAPRGRVIILSAEDDAADTIVPRLIAAGADLSMVEILQAVDQGEGKTRRTFNLQTDLVLLGETIKRFGDVQLVLIDPISAYFGKGVDSHNDVEVRGVLAPASDMAARLNVAMVSIQHFNKGNVTGTTKALHKFIGSIAFVAGPRIAFAIIEDAEDSARRLFLHVKNNLAPPPPGLAFRVEQAPLNIAGIIGSHIVWEHDVVSMSADEAISAGKSQDTAPALEEAKQFLATIIGSEGMLVKDIKKEAEEACMSWATIRRAKEKLGLKSTQVGFAGPWKWTR